MSAREIIAALFAVALIIGSICGAIGYTQYQQTQRRQTCAETGGSWVKDSQCLRFVQVQSQ